METLCRRRDYSPFFPCFYAPTGVALLANAPERLPERKKRTREGPSDGRPAPPSVGSGAVKPTSRGAKHRVLSQREEQLAIQRVGNQTFKSPLIYPCSLFLPCFTANSGNGGRRWEKTSFSASHPEITGRIRAEEELLSQPATELLLHAGRLLGLTLAGGGRGRGQYEIIFGPSFFYSPAGADQSGPEGFGRGACTSGEAGGCQHRGPLYLQALLHSVQ